MLCSDLFTSIGNQTVCFNGFIKYHNIKVTPYNQKSYDQNPTRLFVFVVFYTRACNIWLIFAVAILNNDKYLLFIYLTNNVEKMWMVRHF